MRIGLLGLGMMGRHHLASYATLPDVEVVTRESASYASVDGRDRDALLSAMIADPTLDAIDICLPTPSHPGASIAALHAGKHVLCEKPMALDNANCLRVLEAADQNNGVFMVAHVLRFSPAYRYLAESVKTGRYGSLKSVRFVRSCPFPTWGGWFLQPDESGGGVFDLLIHDFDQSIALLGMPDRITVEPVNSGSNSADSVDCVLRYSPADNPDAPCVDISGGWFADGRPFSMSFHVRFAEADLIYENNLLSVQRAGAAAESVPLPSIDPYAEQLRYFIECCRNHRFPSECPPESSASAVALALAVRSLMQCAPGTLTPFNWK